MDIKKTLWLFPLLFIPLVAADIFQVGGYIGTQVPTSYYLGGTATLSDTLTTGLTCVSEPGWVRELYTMCAVIAPNGTVVWSEGPTLNCDTQSYTCTHTQTFDSEGSWKFGLSWGYINKTWNGSVGQWNVTQSLAESHRFTIVVSGAPPTSPADLQILLDLFLAFL